MFIYIMTETGTEEYPTVAVLQSEEEYDLQSPDFAFILRMFAEEAVNNSHTQLDYYDEFERLLEQEKDGYVGLYKRNLDTLPNVIHNDRLWAAQYVDNFSLEAQHDRAVSTVPS